MYKTIKIKIISLSLSLSILGSSYILIKNINNNLEEINQNNPTYEDYLSDNTIKLHKDIYYIENNNDTTKLASTNITFNDYKSAEEYLINNANKQIISTNHKYFRKKISSNLLIGTFGIILSSTSLIAGEAFLDKQKRIERYIIPISLKRKLKIEELLSNNQLDKTKLTKNELNYLNVAINLPINEISLVLSTSIEENKKIQYLMKQYHSTFEEISARIIEIKCLNKLTETESKKLTRNKSKL